MEKKITHERDMEEEIEKCRKCGEDMFVHDIDILNLIETIGTYCNNEKCEHYKVLIV